jgi:two-component system OmpR family sensor kinase
MTRHSKEHGDIVDSPCKDDFFGRIDVEFLIHELKDPIAVVETAVRMLLEKPHKYGALTNRQEKTLKRALKSSMKVRGLLSDMLEVGRSDAGCFRCDRFNPVAVVGEVLMEVLEATDTGLWEMLQDYLSQADRAAVLKRSGIRLIFPDGMHDLQMCQDEPKFRQIVGNLIKNALQHRRRFLEVGLDHLDDRLMVEVIDDGPGVDKESRELIFKRYTRMAACTDSSRPGHGLGLAGARTLARRLGGDVSVRSNRGSGAVFCLTLPLTLER